MKLALLGLGLMFATGCAAAGHAPNPMATAYAVHVSPQWDAARQTVILDALADWTNAAGVTFDVAITDDACSGSPETLGNESCFAFTAPQSALAVTQDCSGEPAVGCTYSTLSQHVLIGVDASPGAPDFAHIVRHEIGHALGLQHSLTQDSVMFPSLSGSATVTSADVAQYWSVR